MNDKELRKISRKDLLELMLAQAKRIEELEKELEKTQKSLVSKKILIKESGNLAEASLRLSGIFELAQKTAEEYIENTKENCKELEKKTQKELEKQNKMKLKKMI